MNRARRVRCAARPAAGLHPTTQIAIRVRPPARRSARTPSRRRAAEMAMRARACPADIGLLMAGSSASDTMTPARSATSRRPSRRPRVRRQPACTSSSCTCTSDLMRRAPPPFVLVVVPEASPARSTPDRATAVLFRDGAARRGGLRIRVVLATAITLPRERQRTTRSSTGAAATSGRRADRSGVRGQDDRPALPGARD